MLPILILFSIVGFNSFDLDDDCIELIMRAYNNPDLDETYTNGDLVVESQSFENDYFGYTKLSVETAVADADGKPIVFDESFVASQITVTADGQVCYPDDQNNPQPLGMEIGLWQFNNPSGLMKVSGSMYQQSLASGEPRMEVEDEVLKRSVIRSGYLEASNVQTVDEIVNLIVAQRAYEMNSKVITASDQMLQQANNLRR